MSWFWVTLEDSDFFILSFPTPLLHTLMVLVAQSLLMCIQDGCSCILKEGIEKIILFYLACYFFRIYRSLIACGLFFLSEIQLQLTNGSKTQQVGYTQVGGCCLIALASFLGRNYLISCLRSSPSLEFWGWNILSAAVPCFTIILQTPKMQCYLSG